MTNQCSLTANVQREAFQLVPFSHNTTLAFASCLGTDVWQYSTGCLNSWEDDAKQLTIWHFGT